MVNAVSPLPVPGLPQMTSENSISLNDLNVAGGVFVRIQQYEDAARGDYITVLWDNLPVKEVIVDDLSSDFPIVVVITKGLDVGSHYINYTSRDVAGNTGTSTGITVDIIDGQPEIKYPAPVFTDAVNGVINQSSITANAGTHVHIAPYTGIKANDTVTLFWKGMSASGDISDGGVESHVILTTDMSAGVTFLIPENKLEYLGDKGTVSACYQVRRTGSVLGVSEFSEVMLDLSGSSSDFGMVISTGAANTDYNAIHVYPFNQGIIKGPAGSTVILSIVGDAVFYESGSATYQAILNQNGQSSFRLYSSVQSNVQVYAEASSNPGASVQQLVRFGPYSKGNGNIQYYNFTTGAPANGLIPCSIYLKTAQSSALRAEISKVRVTVSGSATIDGYASKTADILLNSDKSAEIDIINSVAETVDVELSLPESSGSINRLSLIFKTF
ncbi:hypothetical protein [Lonsdalea iberica]|uniref:Uncharacterized protein n=1 Tax=Lonsdalea iberica TaxID=1082703 RepID=A0A1X3RNT5_9GAMM|nr:hypothetical protein [Lonsdalea iberica]OSN03452.1 hypothetical protein AU511_14875 [Lonsdalea iberica]